MTLRADIAVPVAPAEDRSILVPPGATIVTGYVRIDCVRLACKDRMAVGDIERAYNRRIQLGASQPWPCPRGHWEGEGGARRFVIVDGRHEYVAALMLGVDHILVAWLELKPLQSKPRKNRK